MTKQEYDQDVHQLKRYAAQLLYVIQSQLENDSPDDFVGGSKFNNPRLKIVTDSIDNVLGSYDHLQEALGLEPGDEPRHRKFLQGRCH